MSHEVETMAWAREVPWHGLGVQVKDTMTPQEMLKAAGLDWTVSKRVLKYCDCADNEKAQVIGNVRSEYALVRDSDNSVLSLVGSVYKPVQNANAFDFFKKYVNAGHMKMETAGSLRYGRYVWALARCGVDFSIGKGDKDRVKSYLLLVSPHVHGKSLLVQFTPIRVVCMNTMTMAVGSNLKGKRPDAFRMPHKVEFDDSVKAQAEAAIGIVKKQAAAFKEAANFLASKRAKADQVEDYFFEVLHAKKPAPPKAGEQPAKEPQIIEAMRQALTYAPGHDLASAEGTWWGAVNSVTYVIDHMLGVQRDTALHNAWLGQKATWKRRAFDLALDKAK